MVRKSSSWGTTQVDVSNGGRSGDLRRSLYKGGDLKKLYFSLKFRISLNLLSKASPNFLNMRNTLSLLWAGTSLMRDNWRKNVLPSYSAGALMLITKSKGMMGIGD